MRKFILTFSLLIALGLGSLTDRAEAMALPAPASLAAVIAESGFTEKTYYTCRRIWVCGPYGCGWRQQCWWTGPRWRNRSWNWRRWRH